MECSYVGWNTAVAQYQQGGADDLEDLLNFQMIAILRVSTAQYGYVTAYRLTDVGKNASADIPAHIWDEVHSLVFNKCNKPMTVMIQNKKFFFKYESSKLEILIPIDTIEDVPYATNSFLPSFNYGSWGAKKWEE